MSGPDVKYNYQKVLGPLSIVPIHPDEMKDKRVFLFILMGPTGAGKSSFVESLAPNQSLCIAKNTLESVTQQVILYHVVNLSFTHSDCVLMDTPGFLDTQLSESRVTKMISSKLSQLRQSASSVVANLIYFLPITDIRMSGTRKESLALLRSFAKTFEAGWVDVITTMWNRVKHSQIIEDRFEALKEEVKKHDTSPSFQILKFDFDQHSALSVLDQTMAGWPHHPDTQKQSQEYQVHLCNSLLNRIGSTQQHLERLEEERRVLGAGMGMGVGMGPGQVLEDPERELIEIVNRERMVAIGALQKFIDDLLEFEEMGMDALRCYLDARYRSNPGLCQSRYEGREVVERENERGVERERGVGVGVAVDVDVPVNGDVHEHEHEHRLAGDNLSHVDVPRQSPGPLNTHSKDRFKRFRVGIKQRVKKWF